MATVKTDDPNVEPVASAPAEQLRDDIEKAGALRSKGRSKRTTHVDQPTTVGAANPQTPFGVIIDPGHGDAPAAVNGYFFNLDKQGKVVNEASIPTERLLQAARQSGLPVFIGQQGLVYRGFLDPSGHSVRRLPNDRPITPDSNLARSLAMPESQQHVWIERHLENQSLVDHLLAPDNQLNSSAQDTPPEQHQSPSMSFTAETPTTIPKTAPIAPVPALPVSAPTLPGGEVTVEGSLSLPSVPVTSEFDAISQPGNAAEQLVNQDSEIDQPTAGAVDAPIDSSPTDDQPAPSTAAVQTTLPAVPKPFEVAAGDTASSGDASSRQRTPTPSQPRHASQVDSAETTAPTFSQPVLDEPVRSGRSAMGESSIDPQQASPAYVESGAPRGRGARRRRSSAKPAGMAQTASAIAPSADFESRGSETISSRPPSTAERPQETAPSAPQPRVQQTGRPSQLSRHGLEVPSDTPRIERSPTVGTTDEDVSPVYRNAGPGSRPPQRPDESGATSASDVSAWPADEDIDDRQISQTSPDDAAPKNDGGQLTGVSDAGYIPYVNPSTDPNLQPVLQERPLYTPNQEDVWTKDLAKQKLESLKATRRSTAKEEISNLSRTPYQPQSPLDPLTQSVNAADSYNKPELAERAKRFGTLRALRNARDFGGSTAAYGEQLALTEARNFVLAAQRRSWQMAQEVAEDTALSFSDLMLVSGPVVMCMYMSRWVIGYMFGEMASIQAGGFSIPAVPAYSFGDPLDYVRHVKFLIIGIWTLILWGGIAALIYYWSDWTAALDLAKKLGWDGIQAGWQAMVQLLGTFPQ